MKISNRTGRCAGCTRRKGGKQHEPYRANRNARKFLITRRKEAV